MASQEELDRQNELNRLVQELAGITQETLENQRSISNALQDSLGALQFERSERAEIRSITKEVNKIATESRTILKDELGSQKNIAEIQKSQETLRKRKIALENIFSSLTDEQLRAVEALGLGLKDQIDSINRINNELEETKTKSQDIADVFGVKVFTNIEGVAGKLESLTGLKLKQPFSDAADAARSVENAADNSAKAFAAGAQSIAKSATAALPLLIFTQIVKAVLQIDKSSGEIAKNLGVSYNEALGLNEEFTQIAASSDNIFITTQNLGEAFLSINSALGTNSTLSSDLLTTQTELVKQAGYSVEAATQLATLSLATGQSSKDITTEFLGQLTLLNLQNQTSLNEKQILESISKISKGTLATFAEQPKALAQAVYQARLLGLELDQLEKVAEGLLDIESSIRAEFVAQTVTGEELNLGLARRFALENELGKLGEELERQSITRAKFANMNFIQQQAYARALNLERSELGEILLEREAIQRLAGIEGASAQERFNNLVKEVGLLEAKAQIGEATLANQLASVNIQERFNQTISKLSELFVQIAEPLLPILSGIASVLEYLIPAIPTLMFVAGAFTGNPLLIAAGGAGIFGQINAMGPSDVEDGIAPSTRGPFTITDSYGATSITAKGDSLAVSPNVELRSSTSDVNLRRASSERNTGEIVISDAQLNRLADFLAKGAERGTSKARLALNVDGRKLADSQQVPSALGQYRFSS